MLVCSPLALSLSLHLPDTHIHSYTHAHTHVHMHTHTLHTRCHARLTLCFVFTPRLPVSVTLCPMLYNTGVSEEWSFELPSLMEITGNYR